MADKINISKIDKFDLYGISEFKNSKKRSFFQIGKQNFSFNYCGQVSYNLGPVEIGIFYT